MEAKNYSWSNLVEDNPIPLLTRKKFETEEMLVARVHLDAGCTVPRHQHVSEQVAIILSGRVRWTLGDTAREVEMAGGEAIHLPANEPHALIALEDTEIIDILSPRGPMGVDNMQKGAH